MQNQPDSEMIEDDIKSPSPNPNRLTTALLFIGLAILFIGIFLGGGNLDNPSLFTVIFAAVANLLIGADGVIIIIRREAPRPGLPGIKGIGAILSGLALIFSFGCAGIFIIGNLIVELLRK